MTTAQELVGAWRLVSWSLVYDDGRPEEFPLGPDAHGMIMYTAGGEVSALLSRAARTKATPRSEAEKATAFQQSFGYAGRYEVRTGTVYHSIEIATDASLVGVTSTRHISLDGDRLVLSGPDFTAGSPRSHRIVWRRA